MTKMIRNQCTMTDNSQAMPPETDSASAAPAPATGGREAPEDVKVTLTPLRVVLGIIAIILGLGAGFVMSSATLFK